MKILKNTVISVVSYKRPINTTCDMLLDTNMNWFVFIYEFDKNLEKYINRYSSSHVKVIPKALIHSANLSDKRQYVIDTAIKENYKYCIMLDDDITSITYKNNNASIYTLCNTLYDSIVHNNKYVAIAAAYNSSNNNIILEEYKNICNNVIFNLQLLQQSGVTYNNKSLCEDMELTMDLLLQGFITARNNRLIVSNCLQGGSTTDGLSYRFCNKNRFIEEANYMISRYPKYKDIFEYDENHFKMNTNTLLKLIT